MTALAIREVMEKHWYEWDKKNFGLAKTLDLFLPSDKGEGTYKAYSLNEEEATIIGEQILQTLREGGKDCKENCTPYFRDLIEDFVRKNPREWQIKIFEKVKSLTNEKLYKNLITFVSDERYEYDDRWIFACNAHKEEFEKRLSEIGFFLKKI
jgi:hypothetical protein